MMIAAMMARGDNDEDDGLLKIVVMAVTVKNFESKKVRFVAAMVGEMHILSDVWFAE